jgi:hypothetical protein
VVSCHSKDPLSSQSMVFRRQRSLAEMGKMSCRKYPKTVISTSTRSPCIARNSLILSLAGPSCFGSPPSKNVITEYRRAKRRLPARSRRSLFCFPDRFSCSSGISGTLVSVSMSSVSRSRDRERHGIRSSRGREPHRKVGEMMKLLLLSPLPCRY